MVLGSFVHDVRNGSALMFSDGIFFPVHVSSILLDNSNNNMSDSNISSF